MPLPNVEECKECPMALLCLAANDRFLMWCMECHNYFLVPFVGKVFTSTCYYYPSKTGSKTLLSKCRFKNVTFKVEVAESINCNAHHALRGRYE